MRIGFAWIAACLLLAGCGGGDSTPTGTGGGPAASGGGATEDPAARAAEEQAAREREQERNDLLAKKTELRERVRELEQAFDEMVERHEQEREALPDISKFRRRYSQIKADAARAQTKLRGMEERLAELQKLAGSDAASEVSTLQEQRATIQQRYEEALSGWKQAIQDEMHGVVEESPVKRDLTLVRVLKQRWLQATPEARRGSLGSSAKKNINDSFRTWVLSDPQRKDLCTRILTQDVAPGDQRPETYDFTRLEFYVLVELLEDELDRANIAVEKKELRENEAKVAAIEAELDEIDNRISLAMQAGGPEFEEYLDLEERIGAARSLTKEIVQQAESYAQVFAEIDSTRDRQQAAEDDLVAKIEAAKAELKEIDSRLSGR